jgi:regulatory protein
VKISKIEPQKKNKQRSSIFIDGEFKFGLSNEVVMKLDLHVDQELTTDEIQTIVLVQEKERIRERAFRILRFHDRSSLELKDKLVRLGFDEPLVGEVIQDLTADKTVDDERFVQEFVSDYTKLNPKGNVFIAHQLRKKGIPPEVIDKVTETRDERTLAQEFMARKLKDLDTHDPKSKHKIFRRLVSRGFTPGIVYELLSSKENHE